MTEDRTGGAIVRAALAAGLVLAALPAAAELGKPVIPSEGQELAEAVFATVDTDGSGTLSPAETQAFRELVFVSMDTDGDKAVSGSEFQTWGFGFDVIADKQARASEFETVEIVIFDLWDRDNDGLISIEEFDEAIDGNILYADIDGDGAVSKEEFMLNYLPNIAYRAALGDR